eukprot:1026981-Pleurochrysis_carterae.AAC.1
METAPSACLQYASYSCMRFGGMCMHPVRALKGVPCACTQCLRYACTRPCAGRCCTVLVWPIRPHLASCQAREDASMPQGPLQQRPDRDSSCRSFEALKADNLVSNLRATPRRDCA